MILNFVIGFSLIAVLDFNTIVAINSAAIVLSFSIGPVAVVALRQQMPHAKRLFHVPAPRFIAAAGFVVSALIVYWSDWTSMRLLLLIVLVAIITMAIRRFLIERKSWRSFDLREAIWLLPFLGSLTLISWLGNFGGRGSIPFGWDMIILAVLSLINFRIATWCALNNQKATEYRETHKPPPGEQFDTPP